MTPLPPSPLHSCKGCHQQSADTQGDLIGCRRCLAVSGSPLPGVGNHPHRDMAFVLGHMLHVQRRLA
eukprot:scaffold250433_cov37-Prasinocladus_malaysianus.AAC.1